MFGFPKRMTSSKQARQCVLKFDWYENGTNMNKPWQTYTNPLLWSIMIHYDPLWYIMIHYDTLWYIMIHYDSDTIWVRLRWASSHASQLLRPGDQSLTSLPSRYTICVPTNRQLKGFLTKDGRAVFEIVMVHPFPKDEHWNCPIKKSTKVI